MTAYRSLLERLATLAEHLPPSHVVGERPAERVVSALIHFTEFGEQILDAADEAEQHVLDSLRQSPGERQNPTQVVDVLTEPFPAAADPAQAQADQNDRIASLQAQVDALLADRANLPRQTAAGASIPQTEVRTDEPVDLSAPLQPDPPAIENAGAPPTDLPATPTFANDAPTGDDFQTPADAPAPADPQNS